MTKWANQPWTQPGPSRTFKGLLDGLVGWERTETYYILQSSTVEFMTDDSPIVFCRYYSTETSFHNIYHSTILWNKIRDISWTIWTDSGSMVDKSSILNKQPGTRTENFSNTPKRACITVLTMVLKIRSVTLRCLVHETRRVKGSKNG